MSFTLADFTGALAKIVPAFNAIIGALPGLLSVEEADVNAAASAVLKAITDLYAALDTLKAVVQAAITTPPAAPPVA